MRFTSDFPVRSYEVGADGLLHHGNLARFVLHAGDLVTTALGMGGDWMEAHDSFFVVRGLQLEFESGAKEGEMLHLATWLSEAKRVRGYRQVKFTSAADGRAIANAQLDWVYVSRLTLSPARMPADMLERLQLEDERACQRAWQAGADAGPAFEFACAAHHRDLDQLRHVNTAVYVEWFEQALCEAERVTPAQIRGHKLEFLRQTLLGEPMRIVSQRTATGVWRQELRHTQTDEVYVRNELLTA